MDLFHYLGLHLTQAYGARQQASLPIDADWVPPLVPRTRSKQLKRALPMVSVSHAQLARNLSVRHAVPAGFEARAAAFEAWMRLLLLDTMQRMGLFTHSGQVWSSSFWDCPDDMHYIEERIIYPAALQSALAMHLAMLYTRPSC